MVRSLLSLLGLGDTTETAEHAGDTATVRRIARELEALEPQHARFLAAFAFLLGRVAHADLEIDDDETATMERIVTEMGDLPPEQAALAVEIAKAQARLFGGTENFQVARELRSISSVEERRRVLDCLFAVAAADGEISGAEETQIRLIVDELSLTHRDLVAARAAWSNKRSVLRGFNT
ncbi:MAG: TerB family tellurite resistance protein [Acidobacteriota bacterium]